jgi:hypothetical protein
MSANYGETLAPSTLESVQDLKFRFGVRKYFFDKSVSKKDFLKIIIQCQHYQQSQQKLSTILENKII